MSWLRLGIKVPCLHLRLISITELLKIAMGIWHPFHNSIREFRKAFLKCLGNKFKPIWWRQTCAVEFMMTLWSILKNQTREEGLVGYQRPVGVRHACMH